MNKAFILAGVLGLSGSFLYGQQVDFAACVSTHIELPKDTLLLGEPSFFFFVLSNYSDAPIFVEEGGDYRSGRKVSFEVFIITPENDTLPWPELWGAMGGIVMYKKILPGESRKFQLFLPKWAKIAKPGRYRLAVSKHFKIAPEDPFRSEDYSRIQVVRKTSTMTFSVVDNPENLGAFIANLTADIKSETGGRIVEGSAFRIDSRTLKSVSDTLYDRLRMLEEIEDERIVPFLVESYREQKHLEAYKAVQLLAKFPDNAAAYQTLLLAAQGEDNSTCYVTEDSIGIVWSAGFIRQNALQGIMLSTRETALEFLMAKKDDDYPCERYMILVRAKYFLPEDKARMIYITFSADKHKAVRETALKALAQTGK